MFYFTRRDPYKQTPNEDAIALLPVGDSAGVLVIADGCGGQANGQAASQLAIESWPKRCATGATRQPAGTDLGRFRIGHSARAAIGDWCGYDADCHRDQRRRDAYISRRRFTGLVGRQSGQSQAGRPNRTRQSAMPWKRAC